MSYEFTAETRQKLYAKTDKIVTSSTASPKPTAYVQSWSLVHIGHWIPDSGMKLKQPMSQCSVPGRGHLHTCLNSARN